MYQLFGRKGWGSVLTEAQLAWYGLLFEVEEVDDPDADLLAAVDAAEASSGKGTIAPWVKPVKREIEAT